MTIDKIVDNGIIGSLRDGERVTKEIYDNGRYSHSIDYSRDGNTVNVEKVEPFFGIFEYRETIEKIKKYD